MESTDSNTNESNKKHRITVEASQKLILRYDDGSEVAYVPTLVNGNIVMNPVEMVQTSPETEAKVDKAPPVAKEKTKIVTYNNKTIRTVPIPTEKAPTRVPPNTYAKKYTNLGLIRYGLKHLIVDNDIMIQPKEFKRQMLDYSNTVTKADFGPRTKQALKRLSSTIGVIKLFALPAHMMLLDRLKHFYTRHCVTTHQPPMEDIKDLPLLPIGYQLEVDASKTKRISRKRKYPPAQNTATGGGDPVEMTKDEIIEQSCTETDKTVEEIDENSPIDDDEEMMICNDNEYVDENGEAVLFLKAKSGKSVFVKKSNLIIMS